MFEILKNIFITNLVFAQSGATGSPFPNPLKAEFQSVPCLINAIMQIVVQVGSTILVVAVILVGLSFVMARGNEGALTKAKSALLWTAIGAAMVLGAFVISQAIQATVAELGTSVTSTGTAASCAPPATP